MTDYAFTLAEGERFDLAAFDPDFTAGFDSKRAAKEALARNLERLHGLQEAFYADGSHALLVVLQAMDTAGKDGTIEHAMGAFNPQGVVVTPFKAPTEEELAHDFLWRVHRAVPRLGMIGIFNRSHYEDVLVVRVKGLAPEAVWRRRYEQINAFEKLLAENRVTIVKLFLHISPEEQAERLAERQRERRKQWKFNPGDLEDRRLWHDYAAAYEEALTRCNTRAAPWWVVPANHRWFRNLAASEILVETLEAIGARYPEPVEGIERYQIPAV